MIAKSLVAKHLCAISNIRISICGISIADYILLIWSIFSSCHLITNSLDRIAIPHWHGVTHGLPRWHLYRYVLRYYLRNIIDRVLTKPFIRTLAFSNSISLCRTTCKWRNQHYKDKSFEHTNPTRHRLVIDQELQQCFSFTTSRTHYSSILSN